MPTPTYVDRNSDHRHRLPPPRHLPQIDAQRLHRAIDCGAAIEGPYKKPLIHRRQWRALARYMAIVVVLMLMSSAVPFFR